MLLRSKNGTIRPDMSTPEDRGNEPYDPSNPPGLGSWRKRKYTDEELEAWEQEQRQANAGQTPTAAEGSGSTEQKPYATGVRGPFPIRRPTRKGSADQVGGPQLEYDPASFITFPTPIPARPRRGGAISSLLSTLTNRSKRERGGVEASEVKEVYRIGERIPLFRLMPQENNPTGRIRTYSTEFTLDTIETPDLAFSVTLGSPKGAPISMSMPEPNQLTVEADLRKLATEVRDNAACGTFPIEYFYTLDSKLTSVLQRLLLRIYDGENGKIYEALPDQRGLREGGSLTFNDNFHEVKLNGDGKIVSRSPSQHSMAYTLQANTGAENTEAEFLLLSEEERVKF